MRKEYYCSYCGEKVRFTGKTKDHAWKVGSKYQCSATCFSKEFDKKYKASKVNIYGGGVGNTKGKVIDRGYERHGSR